MSAAVSNPTPQGESKTARKKKTKGDTGTPTSEAATDRPAGSVGDGGTVQEGGSELPFLKDLHKYIRPNSIPL
jgi:hypothetical protein